MNMVIYRVQEVGPVGGADGEHGAGLSTAAVHPIQLCEQLRHDTVHDAARVARFPPVKMKVCSLNTHHSAISGTGLGENPIPWLGKFTVEYGSRNLQ